MWLRKNLPAGFFSAFFFSFLGLPPSTGPFLLSLPALAAAAAASGFLLSLAGVAALASPPFLSPFFYNLKKHYYKPIFHAKFLTEKTYSDNGSSRLRDIIKVNFNKREIFSQFVGLDNSVLNKIEPTQSIGSRSNLDAFLIFSIFH